MRLITRNIEVEVEVDGVLVKGRLAGTTEQSAIREQNYKLYTRKVVSEDTGEEETIERMGIDAAAFGRDLFCACITGLGENAVDMDGKPLKCDKKTLGEIYEYNNDFANEAMKKITKAIKEIREGDLKNSKPGVSGTLHQAGQAAKSAN